ncbi:MAG: hypothetical protein HOW73_31825 [Polyangiaceae bacterium]|nr:hypothetical protein [Polyangiaceae bacterium]
MNRLRLSALCLLLCMPVACGDDTTDPEGGGGSGGSGGEPAAGGDATGGGGSDQLAPQCASDVGLADLESGQWDERFTIAGFTGHDGIAPMVYDFARDTDGSIVAAGRFQWLEGKAIPPLMRWKDGAWEPARTNWEIEAPLDGFSAIAISGEGELALATNDSFGERDGEIWLDDGTGLQSVASFKGQVRGLAWFEGSLWVAGLFELDDVPGVANLAVWNGTAWTAAPGGAIDGPAFELLVSDDTLYVGGAFTTIGGAPAANVASFDGTAWEAYDFPDALTIYGLARTDSGALFAGGAYGEFEQAGGLARWDGSAWVTVGGGLGMYQTRGVVTDIVAHGETVDATGCFNTAGGLADAADTVPSQSVARWTGEGWESLDSGGGVVTPWFAPNVCGDEGVTAIWDVGHQRLFADGDSVFAGGSFSGAEGVLSQAIVVHDGTAWKAQGVSGIGIGGSIDRIAAGGEGCDVYGLGMFSHVSGESVTAKVVHYNGNGWDVLADPLSRDAYCPGLDVSRNGEVAVGCMDFPENGDARGVILRRQGDQMVEAPIEGLGPVMNVQWDDNGVLWIVGAGVTGYLARLDGDDLTIVSSDFDNVVNQLDVVSDNDIVVGGAFTKVGAVDASRIARWDGTAWSPLADGIPGQVLALDRDANNVYVSSYDEGNGAYLLGAFDGEKWTELASPAAGVTPQSYFSFNQIRTFEGGLVAVGTADMDDASGRGALVYRDGTFHALGGGVRARGMGGVAVTDDAVWFAGTIAEAGAETDRVSTVGVARYQIAP